MRVQQQLNGLFLQNTEQARAEPPHGQPVHEGSCSGERDGGVGSVCSGGPRSWPPYLGPRLSSAIGWQHLTELEAFRDIGTVGQRAEGSQLVLWLGFWLEPSEGNAGALDAAGLLTFRGHPPQEKLLGEAVSAQEPSGPQRGRNISLDEDVCWAQSKGLLRIPDQFLPHSALSQRASSGRQSVPPEPRRDAL